MNTVLAWFFEIIDHMGVETQNRWVSAVMKDALPEQVAGNVSLAAVFVRFRYCESQVMNPETSDAAHASQAVVDVTHTAKLSGMIEQILARILHQQLAKPHNLQLQRACKGSLTAVADIAYACKRERVRSKIVAVKPSDCLRKLERFLRIHSGGCSTVPFVNHYRNLRRNGKTPSLPASVLSGLLVHDTTDGREAVFDFLVSQCLTPFHATGNGAMLEATRYKRRGEFLLRLLIEALRYKPALYPLSTQVSHSVVDDAVSTHTEYKHDSNGVTAQHDEILSWQSNAHLSLHSLLNKALGSTPQTVEFGVACAPNSDDELLVFATDNEGVHARSAAQTWPASAADRTKDFGAWFMDDDCTMESDSSTPHECEAHHSTAQFSAHCSLHSLPNKALGPSLGSTPQTAEFGVACALSSHDELLVFGTDNEGTQACPASAADRTKDFGTWFMDDDCTMEGDSSTPHECEANTQSCSKGNKMARDSSESLHRTTELSAEADADLLT